MIVSFASMLIFISFAQRRYTQFKNILMHKKPDVVMLPGMNIRLNSILRGRSNAIPRSLKEFRNSWPILNRTWLSEFNASKKDKREPSQLNVIHQFIGNYAIDYPYL